MQGMMALNLLSDYVLTIKLHSWSSSWFEAVDKVLVLVIEPEES